MTTEDDPCAGCGEYAPYCECDYWYDAGKEDRL